MQGGNCACPASVADEQDVVARGGVVPDKQPGTWKIIIIINTQTTQQSHIPKQVCWQLLFTDRKQGVPLHGQRIQFRPSNAGLLAGRLENEGSSTGGIHLLRVLVISALFDVASYCHHLLTRERWVAPLPHDL